MLFVLLYFEYNSVHTDLIDKDFVHTVFVLFMLFFSRHYSYQIDTNFHTSSDFRTIHIRSCCHSLMLDSCRDRSLRNLVAE